MRGRLAVIDGDGLGEGNTPAYAGKTTASARTWASGKKHPRVCGEDEVTTGMPHTDLETPPRMRGRQ